MRDGGRAGSSFLAEVPTEQHRERCGGTPPLDHMTVSLTDDR